MFQAIALLFLLTNGVPEDRPIDKGIWKDTFPSLEACKEFQASDAGKLAAAGAMGHPLVISGKAIVKFDCVPKEDNSI